MKIDVTFGLLSYYVYCMKTTKPKQPKAQSDSQCTLLTLLIGIFYLLYLERLLYGTARITTERSTWMLETSEGKYLDIGNYGQIDLDSGNYEAIDADA